MAIFLIISLFVERMNDVTIDPLSLEGMDLRHISMMTNHHNISSSLHIHVFPMLQYFRHPFIMYSVYSHMEYGFMIWPAKFGWCFIPSLTYSMVLTRPFWKPNDVTTLLVEEFSTIFLPNFDTNDFITLFFVSSPTNGVVKKGNSTIGKEKSSFICHYHSISMGVPK